MGPSSITAGPDGALWFTEFNDSIGRITTNGVVTNFTDPSIASPAGITVGADGALWFTNFDNSSIGRITTTGVISNFTDPNISFPLGIVAGPDGALWFTQGKPPSWPQNCVHDDPHCRTDYGAIGRITTTGVVTSYGDKSISAPVSIAAGSDGALWFTNHSDPFARGSIGRITTSGAVTTYTNPKAVSNPVSITVLHNGLAFTNDNDSIGQTTTHGSITQTSASSISAPDGIVAGPDGALWFTNQGNNSIGRLVHGAVTNFTGPGISAPVGIAAGSDGALWFTNFANSSIGRITTSGAVQVHARGRVPFPYARPVPVHQATPASTSSSAPTARIGAWYFDGWAVPVTNPHFQGLERPGPLGGPPNGQFLNLEPLYGWRDDTVETMRTQLAWARQAGISFFDFEWFTDVPGENRDHALGNYLKLKDHNGVGFALTYVAGGTLTVPLSQLPAVADKWVTQYMLNPDYVRVDGKPLLTIFDTQLVNQPPPAGYGGAVGVNQMIQIIQDAAKKHGLPGVYIVGSRQDFQDYSWADFPTDTVPCVYDCSYDGQLTQEHFDAITKFGTALSVSPIDGLTPITRVINQEEQVYWRRYEQSTAFHWIPTVATGFDGRPGYAIFGDVNQQPRLFWFEREPTEIEQFIKDAITAADTHPQLDVVASPGQPPLIMVDSWNAGLGEGHYVVPTAGSGYAYEQAIAAALGIPFHTTHPRTITAKAKGRALAGTLTVTDNWSPCDVDTVLVQTASATLVGTTATKPGGAFSFRLRRPGTYRLRAAKSTKYLQTCAATTGSVVAH